MAEALPEVGGVSNTLPTNAAFMSYWKDAKDGIDSLFYNFDFDNITDCVVSVSVSSITFTVFKVSQYSKPWLT